jgi:hypothetical protein
MIYSVEINDKSDTGKSLIVFLRSLAKTSKEIQLMETVEDNELLAKMLAAKKSGRAGKNEIRKTLKSIISK